jgi:polyphenol oxidase
MELRNGIFSSTVFDDEGLPHGFTTRLRGNLGFGKTPGDPDVLSNRKKLFDSENVSGRRLIQPKQIHSSRCIAAAQFFPGAEADATYTESKQDLLSILTADCLPLLVYHPDGMVAAIHAGWRGLYDEIIPGALSQLPPGAYVAIGPSIGPCCYEVHQDLAGKFVAKFGQDVVLSGDEGKKPHLDLRQVAITQLQQAEVRALEVSEICTSCHRDLFFSYRRDGSSGRMMAFIGLV